MEAARCMLYAKSIPLLLWGEAVNHANYVLNRTLMKGNTVTPYEEYFNIKPDISNLFIFGSKAYYHIPKELRKKLDSKCREEIVVGICDTTKAFRIWDSEKKKIIISRDVCIDELAKPKDIPHSIPRDISTFEKFKENMLQEEMFPQMETTYRKENVLHMPMTDTSFIENDIQQENIPSTEAGGVAEVPKSLQNDTPTEVEFSISRDELVPDSIPVTSTANEPITADEIDPSMQVPTPTVRRSTRIRILRIIQSMVSLYLKRSTIHTSLPITKMPSPVKMHNCGVKRWMKKCKP
jgi:hypothetical protein